MPKWDLSSIWIRRRHDTPANCRVPHAEHTKQRERYREIVKHVFILYFELLCTTRKYKYQYMVQYELAMKEQSSTFNLK